MRPEAPTELEAWEKAFPHVPIPSAGDALFGPDPYEALASALAAELAAPAQVESLFD